MEGVYQIKLPVPVHRSKMPLEDLLERRRTVRVFSSTSLSMNCVSQLLWAAQGVNADEMGDTAHRSAPSAGATYPLVLYVLSGLGVHIYDPLEHALDQCRSDDLRKDLSCAALTEVNQHSLADAPLTILLAVDNDVAQLISPIWEDVLRFVYLEAGHVTQSLALQAQALGLGLCTITSYTAGAVYRVLKVPLNHRPIYLVPIGFPIDSVENTSSCNHPLCSPNTDLQQKLV